MSKLGKSQLALLLIIDGKVKLRRVDVKRCVVPEHTRSAHTRLIAPADWKKRTA